MLGQSPTLLEVLAHKAGCAVLSDLRYLSPERRRQLARGIADIAAAQFSLREWNDALRYLTRGPAEPSVRTARKRLMEYLDPTAKAGPDVTR